MGLAPGQLLGGMRVDLGSIQLGVVDVAEVSWTVQTLEGWDSPDVRAEITQREGDHGAWAAPVYLSERPVTLTGTIEAAGAAPLDAAIEQLLAAVSLTDTTLVVYETIPKQATVRRSGKPLVARVTDRVATYSVLVTAADPRRYSTTLNSQQIALPSTSGGLTVPFTLPATIAATTVSGEITAANAGSFGTRPLFIIDGPVTSPQIATLYPDGTVRLLAYSQDLATGDQLVIDTDAHTVTLNGTVSRRRFLSGPWPDIPAGQMVTFQFKASNYNSSARLTAQWRSAWI